MKIRVVQFPGSNADWDALHAVRNVLGVDADYVFHKEPTIGDADALVIPGGFSYGDYLRCGAIAGFSAVSNSIREFADQGGPILGICNGFQILTELGLLPGALARNENLRFECRDVHIRVESRRGPFTNSANKSVLRVPVAHAEGRYVVANDTLAAMKRNDQIAFRYCDAQGTLASEAAPQRVKLNPNGSVDDIAGVYNAAHNVLGMMPHPERASEAIVGSDDGFALFASLRAHLGASLATRSGAHA